MLPAASALVGGGPRPRHGGVLQPLQAGAAPQVPPETAQRVSALCNASSTMLVTEASGTVALQKEVEEVREECKQLERMTVAMRAAMVTLVAEVDALSATDKRAESELNAAKARALPASRRGIARIQQPVQVSDPQKLGAHTKAAAQVEYEKKAQDHQKLLAYELEIEKLECTLEDEFVVQLEALEEQMDAAHHDLEVVLQRYADPVSKAARKAESAAVEKLSLKLEQTQDKIDAAKRRKLCMQIAFAEVTSGKSKPGAV